MEARTMLPLAPVWELRSLGEARAGDRVEVALRVTNAGSATWFSQGLDGLLLAYHWLDPRGNAIVWDGVRTPFREPVPPGAAAELAPVVIAPRPPGSYMLRFDLVQEHRFWLSELGVATLDVPVTVGPRITSRRLAVVVHGGPDPATTSALAAQEEPPAGEPDDADAVAHLVAGCEPAPDWAGRMLDAHAEGWAAVGPALVPTGPFREMRDARRRLAAWAPGGRNPRFDRPLLLPSLLAGLEPAEHDGLPAWRGEDALFDGGATVRLPTRSGRPRS